MKSLKLIFTILIFSIAFHVQSQVKQYYLEIPDSANIPSKVVTGGVMRLVFSNSTLTNAFDDYTITGFDLAFPGATSPALQIVYIIECDPALIDVIERDFSAFFGRNEEILPVQPLYIPNDFGGTTSNPLMAQPELTFIGAQQAWDISKADGISLGVAESVYSSHEDLTGKITNLGSTNLLTNAHGTQVSVLAGGNTDNNTGVASIGFNAHVVAGLGASYSSLIPLAANGARVINMSWVAACSNSAPLGNEYGQNIMDQLWNSGIFLVAAAGNGLSCSGFISNPTPQSYHYPAALNHVFAVTGVGHIADASSVTNGNRQDIFPNFNIPSNAFGTFTWTYNDQVDLNAPSYDVLLAADPHPCSGCPATLVPGQYWYGPGTSYAAPLVTGTVALMFGANPCLFPDEVESILKLTAIKNDQLTLNLPYTNKLGAGRLRSDLAVDMANDMKLSTGTVEVHDRIIDKWDFNLRTAPYEIKMANNIVSNIATINFIARNNIELLSGDYAPSGTGFVDLKINPVNEICNTPSVTIPRPANNQSNNTTGSTQTKLYPNPNSGEFTMMLNEMHKGEISVRIFDVIGKSVYQSNENKLTFDINVKELPSGIYLVRLSSQNQNEILKFIKQ
jgi:subtilase family protein/type IX secretion system substrate protein